MSVWVVRALVVLAVIAAGAALAAGIHSWIDGVRKEGFAEGDRAGAARVKGEWDEAERQRNLQTLADLAERDRESKRIQAKQESNRAEGERERLAALADARAARAESLRLSEWADAQVAVAAAASRGAGDSDAGQQCAAASAAARVLAHVLRLADERAGILADYADRARAAGLQCQRDYEALTLKPSPP